MTAAAILIQAIAFYSLYNTSGRTMLSRDSMSVWLQGHTFFSKSAGLILLIFSFSLFVAAQGLAVGIFIGFLSLMTTGSLIILFVPLTIKNN